jgi:4-amino-4-deoxy-L-arabinose transferase-like glycosyltransferase
MNSLGTAAGKNKWLWATIFLGLLLRLIDIARPFSGLGKWNEGHYAMTALNYFNYGIFLPMNEYGLDLTTGPLFSWLIYLSFIIFGVHEWAARLPSLFFGILSLILVYYIALRLYNEKVALTATFIAAVSPGIAYFSRNVQLESMFTAFTLAALLFMIYYKDTNDTSWLVASAIYLSIAILTKYPAILAYPALLFVWLKYGDIKNDRREWKRLILYIFLSLFPALLWLLNALETKPVLTTWYFYKPEGPPWSFQSSFTALYEAMVRFIPEHFGYLFYYPLLLATPFLIWQWKRHSVIIIFTLTWLLLIFSFPDFYLANMYYHYSMLYGMSILLGYTIVSFRKEISKHVNLNLKLISPFVVIVILGISIFQYNVFFHSYFTDFSKANEIEPFFSAKYVKSINSNKELVVADLPPTMFYLGGDPEYIRLAYTTEGLISAVKEDKFTYLVTYYSGNRTLNETLREHNYIQIAPRAWKKSS